MLDGLVRRAGLALALNLIVKGANVIAFAVVARLAGPAEAGVFALATTFLLILAAVTWGLDDLLIRQVARDKTVAPVYFSRFVVLRVLLSVLLCLVLWGLLLAAPYPPATLQVIAILGLSLIPDGVANVSLAILTAHEYFGSPVAIGFLASAVKLIGMVVALTGGYGLAGVAWAWVLGNLISAGLLFARSAQLAGLGRMAVKADWAFWRDQARVVFPFLFISGLLALEYQTDVIILSILGDATAVGLYSATTTVIFTLMLVPQAYRAAIFPRMADSNQTAPEALWKLYEVSFQYLGAAALPAAIALNVLGPRIIQLVYGNAFDEAVWPLRILAWSLLFLFLTVPNSRLLLVKERQKWLAVLLVISMATNIALNFMLTPSWGPSGAALARLCSSAFFFVANYVYIIRNIHNHRPVRALLPTVLAGGVLAASLMRMHDVALWIVIPAGVAIYGGFWIALEQLLGGRVLHFREAGRDA